MLNRPDSLRPRRSGFSLVELLVVMVLLGLVGGGIVTWMLNQQRFYRGQTQIIDTRNRVRSAISLLPSAFRSISPIAGDIYAMSDSGFDFRFTTGSSVICVIGNFTAGKAPTPSTQPIIIPGTTLLKNNTLTAWLTKPVAGDSVFVYDPGANTLGGGSWQVGQLNQVLNVSGGGGCLSTTGLTQATDTATSYQLTITAPSDMKKGTISVGSPIRFFRRVRYGLYQTGSGRWYLGYSDCLPGRTPICSSYEAVSGPYRAYSSSGSGATSGIKFTYLDSLGNVTADRTQVARIIISARGQSIQAIQTPGEPPGLYSDSMSTSVGIRNRS